MLICLLIISADCGALPLLLGRLRVVPFGDQIGHFFLIGMLSLTFTILTNFKVTKLGKFTPFLGCLVVFVLITIEEGSQMFLKYRTFSVLDMIANYLGIIVFGHLLGIHLCSKIQSAIPKNEILTTT